MRDKIYDLMWLRRDITPSGGLNPCTCLTPFCYVSPKGQFAFAQIPTGVMCILGLFWTDFPRYFAVCWGWEGVRSDPRTTALGLDATEPRTAEISVPLATGEHIV
jgi:hypothetical protein